MGLCGTKNTVSPDLPVTSTLRQLAGIRIRVCYQQRKQQLLCLALRRAKINTRGHPGLSWGTRKRLSSFTDPDSGVGWWEGTGRWRDKPKLTPDITGVKRGKAAGILGTGPREFPVIHPTASPWPGMALMGCVQLGD